MARNQLWERRSVQHSVHETAQVGVTVGVSQSLRASAMGRTTHPHPADLLPDSVSGVLRMRTIASSRGRSDESIESALRLVLGQEPQRRPIGDGRHSEEATSEQILPVALPKAGCEPRRETRKTLDARG